MPATCQLKVAQQGRERPQCQSRKPNRTKRSVILVTYSDLRRRTSDDGHRNYRPRTKVVVIAATRPARALAARSLTSSKPRQRALSSTASTSKADACAMLKKRRREGERPGSQRALVRAMTGEVRRTFTQVERDADGGAAAVIGPTWNEPSECWGARPPFSSCKPQRRQCANAWWACCSG